MSHLIEWLSEGSKELESVQRTVIGKTLTTNTYTLLDNRVFVVVENYMISYTGFYVAMTSEEKLEINAITNQQFSL